MKRGRIIRWSMRREFMLFWVILHSCARNSTNGTILRTKTGDDIVRMSVMMIDDNIFRPNRHLEDENCTCEMRVGSKDFFPRRERATFGEVNRGIGLSWVCFKRLIWLHIFFGTFCWNPPRTWPKLSSNFTKCIKTLNIFLETFFSPDSFGLTSSFFLSCVLNYDPRREKK